MDRIDSLSMRLCRVAPSIRTALVAECLGRVYPIYQEAWSGDYCPAIRRSLELGRMYGCGLPIDPVELQGCKEYVEDVLNYYQEDGYDILSATVTVSFRLLESMSPDEGEAMLAVARGMCSTFDTVNSAEAMVIDYALRQNALRSRSPKRRPGRRKP